MGCEQNCECIAPALAAAGLFAGLRRNGRLAFCSGTESTLYSFFEAALPWPKLPRGRSAANGSTLLAFAAASASAIAIIASIIGAACGGFHVDRGTAALVANASAKRAAAFL